MTRSIETTVTFRRPFTLAALDGVQPAGTYRLVEEQEEIAGLSFDRLPAGGHLAPCTGRSRAWGDLPGRARLAG